jgi:hypothetical protein
MHTRSTTPRLRAVTVLIAVVAALGTLAAPASSSTWRFEKLDGVPSPTGGRSADTMEASAVVEYGGRPHVFYRSTKSSSPQAEKLRHAWWTGTRWAFEDLDGTGVPGGNGRFDGFAGRTPFAMVFGSQLHVFYFRVVPGDTNAAVLRQGFWDGRQWWFQDLDGNGVAGGGGRINSRVGGPVSGVLFGGVPHIFYAAAINLAPGAPGDRDLRHAWWTGSRWAFETLDGAGGGGGRVDGEVGYDNSSVVFNGGPHVFHWGANSGAFNQTLRHSWWDPVRGRWFSESLEGVGVTGGGGRLTPSTCTMTEVGSSTSTVLFASAPHVFYKAGGAGSQCGLRHAWWTGSAWVFETVDAQGATCPCPGLSSDAILHNGTPHVWHRASGGTNGERLRQTWWNGRRWQSLDIDGPAVAGGGGRTGAATASQPAAISWARQPHVFYSNSDSHVPTDSQSTNLRHAWFG